MATTFTGSFEYYLLIVIRVLLMVVPTVLLTIVTAIGVGIPISLQFGSIAMLITIFFIVSSVVIGLPLPYWVELSWKVLAIVQDEKVVDEYRSQVQDTE